MVDISTSLLSVKKEKIIDTVYKLEDANTNYFHIDVMDGEFVENDTHDLMLEYCEYLDNITKVPLDIHLMVEHPISYIERFKELNPSIITIHKEINDDIRGLLKLIRSYGIKAGVAINPMTQVREIQDILSEVDSILVMSVNPGLGGQKFLASSIIKVGQIRSLNKNVWINVDGGINDGNVKYLDSDIVVSGSYVCKSDNINKQILRLKEIIDEKGC